MKKVNTTRLSAGNMVQVLRMEILYHKKKIAAHKTLSAVSGFTKIGNW